MREEIGKLACTQPLSHVATATGVGPRFVQECFHTVALQKLTGTGLNLDELQPPDTPEFLGIDEYARRTGHHYDMILCDLVARQVLEVSAGRKQEEVIWMPGLRASKRLGLSLCAKRSLPLKTGDTQSVQYLI